MHREKESSNASKRQRVEDPSKIVQQQKEPNKIWHTVEYPSLATVLECSWDSLVSKKVTKQHLATICISFFFFFLISDADSNSERKRCDSRQIGWVCESMCQRNEVPEWNTWKSCWYGIAKV